MGLIPSNQDFTFFIFLDFLVYKLHIMYDIVSLSKQTIETLPWNNTINIMVGIDIDNGVSAMRSNLDIHCIDEISRSNNWLWWRWCQSHLWSSIDCSRVATLKLDWLIGETNFKVLNFRISSLIFTHLMPVFEFAWCVGDSVMMV